MSHPASNARRQRGFSLIEMAICCAVSAVMLASAAPGMRGLLDRQRLAGVAANLASDIQHVRADAVARNEALRLSFHTEAWGSCYIVHTGNRNQCACAAAGPAQCSGGAVQLKTLVFTADNRVAVQANVSSILFDPLHGTGTPSGSIDVVSPNGQAIRHVVNVMGRVRTCSPAGSAPAVPGLNAC